MFKGFRDFILRGNVVDLAVAVILGAAFELPRRLLRQRYSDADCLGDPIGKPDLKKFAIIVHNTPHSHR